MGDTTNPERIVLRASLSELERLSAWIEGIGREAALPAGTVFALQLCLEEAVANVVMYGGMPEDALVDVRLSQSDGRLTAVIEDGARPFDPTQVPPRAKPTSLSETRIGELGVHLIRHYTSAMRYERQDDRNRLILYFDATGGA